MTPTDLRKLAEEALEQSEKATKGPWHHMDYAIVPDWTRKEAGSLQDWSLIRRNDDWCGDDDEQEAAIELMASSRATIPTLAKSLIALLPLVELAEHRSTCRSFDALHNEDGELQSLKCDCGLDAALSSLSGIEAP